MKLNIPIIDDEADTRNRVGVSVYVRMLNLWVLVPITAVWFGGAIPTPLEIPVMGPMTLPDAFGQSFPLYDMRGNPIRVEVEIQRTMRVGVTVTSKNPKEEQ